MNKIKTAVVHEWLASIAGSERVVEQILKVYPDASLFALTNFLTTEEQEVLGSRRINTTFLQKMPWAKKHYRTYLPFAPLAVEQFDLSEYDLVISSNHAVAKGVVCGPNQLHISYVHTPIRYAWDLQHQYLRQAKLERGVKAWLARAILHYLRQWDQSSATRVDAFVANSRYIARRIYKCYRRKAKVINPPVAVGRFGVGQEKEDFYLAASRMVPYKRIDLIVEAFSQYPQRRLIVIGDGPEMKNVKSKARQNVEILGYQDDATLVDYMQRARAFVFAAEEDFGIIPVEAQACGTPVVAFRRGGATETIVDGKTGLFFDHQTPDSLGNAIDQFEQNQDAFDPYQIRAHAEQFSPERFRQEFHDYVSRQWERFQRRIGERDQPHKRSSANGSQIDKESIPRV